MYIKLTKLAICTNNPVFWYAARCSPVQVHLRSELVASCSCLAHSFAYLRLIPDYTVSRSSHRCKNFKFDHNPSSGVRYVTCVARFVGIFLQIFVSNLPKKKCSYLTTFSRWFVNTFCHHHCCSSGDMQTAGHFTE